MRAGSGRCGESATAGDGPFGHPIPGHSQNFFGFFNAIINTITCVKEFLRNV